MTGFVSFVSSGPGDPELLTIKALNRLKDADVVLYDNLSSGPILSHARDGANMINVGKRAGRPSAKQGTVNRLLIEHAETGAKVVRLKSGDAGVFGRLEEEIIALRGADISFEIIPGVTAASAAAAAASIPLTRRETSRRFQYVTGHDVAGALPENLNTAALADPTATTIVYMGRRTFSKLAEKLMTAGLPEDTPALLAESVSTPDQKLSRMSVRELANIPPDLDTNAPALILYGPLADEET